METMKMGGDATIIGGIVTALLTIIGWAFKSIATLRKEMNEKVNKLETKVEKCMTREESTELIQLHIDPLKEDVKEIGSDVKQLLLANARNDGKEERE